VSFSYEKTKSHITTLPNPNNSGLDDLCSSVWVFNMRKKIIYQKGQKINNLVFIKDSEPLITKSGKKPKKHDKLNLQFKRK